MAKDMPGVQKVISLSEQMVSQTDGDSLKFVKIIPDEAELTPELLEKARKIVLDNELFKGSIISEDGKLCFISGDEEYMVSVLDLEKLEFIRKFKRDYPRVSRPKSKTPSRSSLKIPERKYENR